MDWKSVTNFSMWGFLVADVMYKSFTWWHFVVVSILTFFIAVLPNTRSQR